MSIFVSRRSVVAGLFSSAVSPAFSQTLPDLPSFTDFGHTLPFLTLTPDGKTDNLESGDLNAEQAAAGGPTIVDPPLPPRRPQGLSASSPVRNRISRRTKTRENAPAPEQAAPSMPAPSILRGHAPSLVAALRNSNTNEHMRLDFGNYRRQKDEFNHFARDWRQNREIDIANALIEKFGRVAGELGATSFNLFCAYRTPETNRMLQKTSGGQASNSLHLVGKAFDITADGFSAATLQQAALKVAQRDGFGGVGYYPRSEMPFVHIDIGGLRHW